MIKKRAYKTSIRHRGNITEVYPIFIASGEIIAVDASDTSTIIATFKNENDLERAEQAIYYNG